jgi:hypothetical protein
MTRILLAISAVPLAIAGLAALLQPTAPPTIKGDRLAAPAPAAPVQVIQFVRDDAAMMSFAQEPPPLPEARPFLAGRPPLAEPARKIKRKPAGLCARYNLRKIWVTSDRWRCRR